MVSNRGPCPSQGLPRLPEAQLGKCMSVSAGLAVMACVCVRIFVSQSPTAHWHFARCRFLVVGESRV